MAASADLWSPLTKPYRRGRGVISRRGLGLVAAIAFSAIALGVAAVFTVTSVNLTAGGATRAAESRQLSSALGVVVPDKRRAPEGTDPRGFVGYSAAQCNSANPAVALGRTTQSLVVICQNFSGRFYYRALNLQSGQSAEVADCVPERDSFVAVSGDAKYLVSPAALIVYRGKRSVSSEPMVEYWYV